ncbi:MAG: tRNA pseudouridine(55) synthase TruB, partial [Epulopiscium sp. Nuni2H_MBin003]
VILGAYTTTEDSTGDIVETYEVSVTQPQVTEVLQSFVGLYEQIPPMYSAIKINGVRLYELARKNIVVDRPKRQVKILEISQISPLNENRFKIKVECSKGTYIRTLCTDIGRKLNCGAHMGELLRTKVGNFTIDNSVTLAELEKSNPLDLLISIESLFKDYKKIVINESLTKSLYNGNQLDYANYDAQEEFVRVYDYLDNFVGIYRTAPDKLIVEKMFRGV